MLPGQSLGPTASAERHSPAQYAPLAASGISDFKKPLDYNDLMGVAAERGAPSMKPINGMSRPPALPARITYVDGGPLLRPSGPTTGSCWSKRRRRYNRSLWMDVGLLAQAVPVVFSKYRCRDALPAKPRTRCEHPRAELLRLGVDHLMQDHDMRPLLPLPPTHTLPPVDCPENSLNRRGSTFPVFCG